MDFIGAITAELQYSRDITLGDFKSGSVYSDYSNATAYNAGDRVVLPTKAVYERRDIDDLGNVIGTTTGVDPTGMTLSSQTWIKINDNYLAVDERVLYNGQLIILTAFLNSWFGVTATPYFYIDNNNTAGTGFNLFAPIAVYNSLGSTNPDRTAAITEIVDRYAIAGIQYTVSTY